MALPVEAILVKSDKTLPVALGEPKVEKSPQFRQPQPVKMPIISWIIRKG